MLMCYYSEICEPYEFEKEDASGGVEIIRKLSDQVGSGADRSLLRLVRVFVQQGASGKGDQGEEVVDEDEDVPNGDAGELESVVSDAEPEDVCEQLNSEL